MEETKMVSTCKQNDMLSIRTLESSLAGGRSGSGDGRPFKGEGIIGSCNRWILIRQGWVQVNL